jgi:hypothetical protein
MARWLSMFWLVAVMATPVHAQVFKPRGGNATATKSDKKPIAKKPTDKAVKVTDDDDDDPRPAKADKADKADRADNTKIAKADDRKPAKKPAPPAPAAKRASKPPLSRTARGKGRPESLTPPVAKPDLDFVKIDDDD